MLLLVIFVVSTSTLSPPSVSASSPTCGATITQSTVLASDIGPCSHTGLTIGASGVTLDCAHHRIVGDGLADYDDAGVNSTGFNRNTVKDCIIINFDTGVWLEGSRNVIADNYVSDTDGWGTQYGDQGFYVPGARNQIIGNVANATGGDGFIIGNRSIVTGNTAQWNYLDGFLLGYHCTDVSQNVAVGNGGNGFTVWLYDHLDSNVASGNGGNYIYSGGFFIEGKGDVLVNNTANRNSYSGFYLFSASSNLLRNNTANYNPIDGYTLDYGGGVTARNRLAQDVAIGNGYNGFDLFYARKNSLTGNIANFNVDGFYLQTSDANTLNQNTADNNNFSGFHISSSNRNVLKSNTATANKLYGFWLDLDVYEDGPSNHTTLTKNVATSNGLSGFLLNDSLSNSLGRNIAQGNGQDGFYLHQSLHNSLTRNSASSNSGYGFVDDSVGSRTMGTANSYHLDLCVGNGAGYSSPSGLCS